jgi:hypothetical protein
MKYQLIPAIGLAALMTWCGFQVAQLDAGHRHLQVQSASLTATKDR